MSTAPTPPQFTAILSTAGSRKTTRLTERAVAHVLAGHAKPEEILLTTLTRSAAAQLHERTVEQFLDQTRKAGSGAAVFLDHCHRLEHAAIGTLHSLGLEVLRRTAIVQGLPVALKVLDDAAETELLTALLDHVDTRLSARLSDYARRLGRHEPQPRRQSGVASVDDVLDVFRMRRRLRIRHKKPSMTACLFEAAELATSLWPTHPIATSISESLKEYYALVESHRGSGLTDEQADKMLRRGFWGAFRGLKDAGDTGLQQRGRHIHSAHWFHEDCVAYATTLGEVAHALAIAYRDEKRRRGVVDYDQLTSALGRFGWPDDPGFIGCDEVQDLTARQIKTIERLVSGTRHPKAESVWVGDEHQHLFAYQGASWAAAMAAIDRLGAAVVASHDNHRSTPLIVNLFNALFPSPRPAQTSGRALRAGEATHVERWTLSTRDPGDDQNDAPLRGRLTMADETRALAAGIADLLVRRPSLRPSDVAVSCRTNAYADHVIRALQQLGIPVDATPRSLAKTREGRIVVDALRLLADPSDSLAAAMVCHLVQDWTPPADTTEWLWSGLRAGRAGAACIDVPGLSEVVHDRDLAGRLAPSAAVHIVITALDLARRVVAWGGAAGRLRNLDAIVAVARGYEARCLTEQRPATIAGLAALFDEDGEESESSRHTRVATGGVTVTTTHSAKGLGWPVAIVAQCAWQPATGDSTFTIRDYEQLDARGRPRRRPHVLPWAFGSHPGKTADGHWFRHPFLPEGAKRADLHQGPYGTAAAALPGAQALAASDEEAERNNIFVACTRAESILVIAEPPAHIPNKKVGKASPTRLDFLQPQLDKLLPPHAKAGVSQTIPGVSATGSLDYTRFDYSPGSVAAATMPPAAVVSAASVAGTIAAFRAIQHSDPYPLEYPPADGSTPVPDGHYPRRFWKPSDEPATHTRGIDPATCTSVPLSAPPLPGRIAAGITRANDNAVGNAIHAFFAALPSLARVPSPQRENLLRDIARRCIAMAGWRLPLDADDLVERAKAFEQWVAAEGLDLITELPLVVERNAQPAIFWRGRIDALGIPRPGGTPDSGNRIIDHKSATGSAPEWLASWLAETGAYADCLRATTAVKRSAVHLPFGSWITTPNYV